MNDPHWTDFFEMLEQSTRKFLRTMFYATGIAFVAICALLLTTCKAFAAGGSYDNDIEGKTVLFDRQGQCAEGAWEVKALTKQGNVRHRGCWIVYNARSVIIMWTGGPATVVPVGNITWVNNDDELPKASET